MAAYGAALQNGAGGLAFVPVPFTLGSAWLDGLFEPHGVERRGLFPAGTFPGASQRSPALPS